MLTPILVSLTFVILFALASNYATVRRERRIRNRRWAEANQIINQALYEPFGWEWEEN